MLNSAYHHHYKTEHAFHCDGEKNKWRAIFNPCYHQELATKWPFAKWDCQICKLSALKRSKWDQTTLLIENCIVSFLILNQACNPEQWQLGEDEGHKETVWGGRGRCTEKMVVHSSLARTFLIVQPSSQVPSLAIASRDQDTFLIQTSEHIIEFISTCDGPLCAPSTKFHLWTGLFYTVMVTKLLCSHNCIRILKKLYGLAYFKLTSRIVHHPSILIKG